MLFGFVFGCRQTNFAADRLIGRGGSGVFPDEDALTGRFLVGDGNGDTSLSWGVAASGGQDHPASRRRGMPGI